MKQKMILLSAQPYDMPDERNKDKRIQGISIFSVPSDNLEPVDGLNEERGLKPAKLNLPLSRQDKLSFFPGFYDVTLQMRSVGGKMQLQATDIDFVATIAVTEAPAAAQLASGVMGDFFDLFYDFCSQFFDKVSGALLCLVILYVIFGIVAAVRLTVLKEKCSLGFVCAGFIVTFAVFIVCNAFAGWF